MPARAARLCSCGAVVQDGGACPSCASRRKRESDSHRPPARKRGYDSQWDKARRGYLARHPYCVMCEAEGQQVLATVVDHIVPHRGDNALFWDRSNWASLCQPHHCGDKQSMEARGRATTSTQVATRVHLICGPPGSGRIEYVTKLMKPGDLFVDLDAIYSAISGLPLHQKPAELLPFACEARDALLRRLARPSGVTQAWIVAGAPKPAERERICRGLTVSVTVLAVPPTVCMRRIMADPERKQHATEWRKMVHDWWDKWQKREGEQVFSGARIEHEGGRLKVFDHAPGPARVPTRETIPD